MYKNKTSTMNFDLTVETGAYFLCVGMNWYEVVRNYDFFFIPNGTFDQYITFINILYIFYFNSQKELLLKFRVDNIDFLVIVRNNYYINKYQQINEI